VVGGCTSVLRVDVSPDVNGTHSSPAHAATLDELRLQLAALLQHIEGSISSQKREELDQLLGCVALDSR